MSKPRAIKNIVDTRVRNVHTPRFEAFVSEHCKSRHLKLFTRRAGNGVVRNYIQVPAGMIQPFVRSFGIRQHIIGLFSVRQKKADHLYLRVGVMAYHLEDEVDDDGHSHWTMNGGGKRNRFREGSQTITERLVKLDPDEMGRLRKLIAEIEADMKTNDGEMSFTGNCVNVWLEAALGRRGEPLADLIGIPERDYAPAVLNQMLELGNERVMGAAVYPARGSEFRRFERTREGF